MTQCSYCGQRRVLMRRCCVCDKVVCESCVVGKWVCITCYENGYLPASKLVHHELLGELV